MATEAFAPAKINLSLHVTGRRADGYHLLDSLVVFADLGDRVLAADAPGLSLTLTGPMAAKLSADDDNLVLRAARLLSATAGTAGRGAAITLDKHLPIAAGLGGGSSDAAAAVAALARLWNLAMPAPKALLPLGADVPACAMGRSLRMTGIGDGVYPLAHPLPQVTLVLVNPRVAVATQAVFAGLQRSDHAPMPRDLPRLRDAAELAAFLAMTRNDLEAPALRLAPVIARVRSALSSQPGCLGSRMSGSGATCFGLFAEPLSAAAAAAALRRTEPGWWVEAAALRS